MLDVFDTVLAGEFAPLFCEKSALARALRAASPPLKSAAVGEFGMLLPVSASNKAEADAPKPAPSSLERAKSADADEDEARVGDVFLVSFPPPALNNAEDADLCTTSSVSPPALNNAEADEDLYIPSSSPPALNNAEDADLCTTSSFSPPALNNAEADGDLCILCTGFSIFL